MKKGTVKWYNVQKRFGFLTVEGEEDDLFFHFNDGRFVERGKEKPGFSAKPTIVHEGKVYPLRQPNQGDGIVFEEDENAQGPIARPWAYNDSWVKTEEWIKAHPAPPPTTYKVLETMNSLGEQPGEPKVLWEGTDLTDLLRRYPVPTGRQSPGSDPLIPYFGDSDNIFETRHWFERKLADGTWEKCPDPRPLGGTNRQF